jgi:iron complex outermembrane receptor protein
LFGGNSSLKPETSDNFDVGFIVAPVKDLGITVDWYRITIKNEIQTIPNTAIYGNPTTFANYYVLNNAGTLTQATNLAIDCVPYTAPTCGYMYQNSQNTGGIETDGLDISGKYLVRTSIGNFKASLEGTLITKYLLQTYTGGPQLNLDGEFNQGYQPRIKWSHELTVDSPFSNQGGGSTTNWQAGFNPLYSDPTGRAFYVRLKYQFL